MNELIGHSANVMLAETDKAEMRERFRPDELAMIRRTIQLSYTGELSLRELSETCAESRDSKRR